MIFALCIALQPGASALAQVAVPLQPPRTNTADSLSGFVSEAAHRFSIPETWIRAVMEAESDGDASAVSPKGAMGLMQIMPDTYAGLRAAYGLGADPFEPRDNILAGAAYLREMYDRFGAWGFLAAYNAGPERYADYVAGRLPLPAETFMYVGKLLPLIGSDNGTIPTVAAASDQRSWMQARLFAVHAGGAEVPMHSAFDLQMASGQDVLFTRGLSAVAPHSAGLFVAMATSGNVP